MVSALAERLAVRYQDQSQDWLNQTWPTLTSYRDRALTRIALPLGGIGTGTVSLGGRGDLRDWEIMQRPGKGHNLNHTFFAIRGKVEGEEPFARCLERAILPHYEGWQGSEEMHAGLPRFPEASFHAAYPFGQVVLSDPKLPIRARIEAFNPLIPPDADRSGIPIAIQRVAVENLGDKPIEISVGASLQNFVGNDGVEKLATGNVNQLRETAHVAGVVMGSEGVDATAEQWGTIALGVVREDDTEVHTSRDWQHTYWSGGLLDWWDRFLAEGMVADHESRPEFLPAGNVSARRTVAAGETASFTFLIGWHFPNRLSWDSGHKPLLRVGNYYTTQYADAWDVLAKTAPELAQLEADTVDFATTFLASPLPDVVKEAALYNASTLRTQTCFRTEDGHFFGWEGCNDHVGSCYGNCTHVWNYEQATPFLFGSLSQSMRETEFLHATTDWGRMSFRANLPLDRASDYPVAAADGQMGSIMKLYREWRLSGNDAWLKKVWPKARLALEFTWVPNGWDGNQDGVMEGCQHNTMDCEYYGPNAQMGFWYLGALRAAEEMAGHLGENELAAKCRDLFERGSVSLEAQIFNGAYYEHIVQPAKAVANGLRLWGDEAAPPADPPLQIGKGCLVDQLVGQYMANVVNLGQLGDREHMRTALRTTKQHGFKEGFVDHFNPMRSYVLNEESAVLMCSYPQGDRPARPFPYYAEVMTGFEYTLAVHMLQEGMIDEGLEIISAIRDRYDGERRSPFNEAECGHHYARAMASWAAVLALSGFDYDGRSGTLQFGPLQQNEPMFWSNGSAWGTVVVNDNIEVAVHQGALSVSAIVINGKTSNLETVRTVTAGEVVTFQG